MADDVIHFCGQTEVAAARAVPPVWRKRELTWRWQGSLPNLADGEALAAVTEAFAAWQAVCGLTFRQTAGQADITLTCGPIDGPAGVLAWSELPDGYDRGLLQQYDTAEAFLVAQRPPPRYIDLVAVACHEIGHAIGLDHTQRGTGDLLEPVYSAGRRTPQPGDVRRAQALYGPAAPTPPATPATPAGGSLVTIQIYDARKIEIPGYKVVRA